MDLSHGLSSQLPTFKVVEAHSPEGVDLLTDLRQTGFVALLGSVISDWEPSGLPPGESLTLAVAQLLARPLKARPKIEEWIRRAAFEHVMEGCPNPEALGNNLLELFSPIQPNPIHQAVAMLIADGTIEHVVTTNYDVNLEAACRMICPASRQPQVIVTHTQVATIEPFRPVIFKIHGCTDYDANREPHESRSMVYMLAQEGELPVWKRRLLYRLLAGRRLFVSGYSGRDFEICPELSGLRADVVWNGRSDPLRNRQALTPNAERVLVEAEGTALVGDMLRIFEHLTNSGPLRAKRSQPRFGLDGELSRGLTDWELALWRMRTLVAIGAGRAGADYAEFVCKSSRLNREQEFHTWLNLGRCQFHLGRYRSASATYRRAAAIATTENRRDWLIGAKSDLVEALRCYGALRRARRELSSLEALIKPNEDWLKAAVALRRVLILRYWYQLSKKVVVLPWVAVRLRRKCRELLTIVVRHAKDGHWLELQQAELWARRLDIRFDELYRGPLNPLPSKEGYQHLGYIIAESMSARDDLRHITTVPQETYLRAMLKDLRRAGANAEFWKMALAVVSALGWNSITPQNRRAAVTAWLHCEYTLPMRVLLLVLR